MKAFHEALLTRGLDSPYEGWLREFDEKPDRITTRVPCGAYFEHRDRALLAHATQIDPRSHWFAVPPDLQRATWPTEDYELARSLVPVSDDEDDLFSGIPADIRESRSCD
jgi:mycothiol S-conjugate amidase